jgi:hypothetical protein
MATIHQNKLKLCGHINRLIAGKEGSSELSNGDRGKYFIDNHFKHAESSCSSQFANGICLGGPAEG